MSFQARKEFQIKFHNQLYNNIYLLTLNYPPTKEFKAVFKEEMFIRNNRAAFHQVIYYLLSILDPVQLKKKVTAWPIFDMKLESQFRREILKYINEMSNIYEDSNIPPIMSSHLISPGGHRFVAFMLKVSELVLLEHLKREEEINKNLLLPIIPSRNLMVSKERTATLKIITENINEETIELMNEFKIGLSEDRNEAETIIQEIKKGGKELIEMRAKCQLLKKDFDKDSSLLNINEGFGNEIEELKRKSNSIQSLSNDFQDCISLAENLRINNILKFDKEKINLKAKKGNFKSDKLNFTNLFYAFIEYVKKLKLTIRPLSKNELDDSISCCMELEEKLHMLFNNFQDIHQELNVLSGNLHKMFPSEEKKKKREPFRHLQFSQINEHSVDNSILAIPLKESPGNEENI